MEYRLFKPSDLQLYLHWVNQREIWEVDNSGPYLPKTVENFKDHFGHIVSLNQSYMILLDGKEIGYVGLIEDSEQGLTPEFFIVIGDLSQQNQGHGKAIMGWLENHARSNGLTTLLATVLGNNERAMRFYKKLGFTYIGEFGERYERNGKWFYLQRYELKL